MPYRCRGAVLAAAMLAAASGCALLYSDISREDAHQVVANGALLLDVRTPEEYAAGHIEGARNIPVQTLAAELEAVGPKERPIVVYCEAGVRSSRAKTILQDNGFATVHNLGAMSRW